MKIQNWGGIKEASVRYELTTTVRTTYLYSIPELVTINLLR